MFEEVSYASAAVGISLITILQAQNILTLFGSPQLQQEFLPLFSKGLLSSYALTEANHGSDIRSLDTKAIRRGDELGCPSNFNLLTVGWYLNEPAAGEEPNMVPTPTSELLAARYIAEGEELTVRYAAFALT